MSKNFITEDANLEFENFKKEQINKWIKNGADSSDAEQLFEDMINDPYYSDQDMDIYFDYTINERIQKYS